MTDMERERGAEILDSLLKRGRRESGDGPVKSESLQEAMSSVKSGRPAAANPAVPICVSCGWTVFNWNDERDARGQHIDSAHERIRALEASNKANRDAWRIAENRVAALEAEVERLRMIFRSHQIKYSECPDERTEDC